jgi:hypothetical protein
MTRWIVTALACATISTTGAAQTAPVSPVGDAAETPAAPSASAQPVASIAPAQPAPLVAPVQRAAQLRLPANTSLTVALNNSLNTKTFHTGDKFSLTVSQDVMAGDRVVIPHGTRAVGQVNWAKGNGSFGKSGKIELAFRYIELGGKKIPLEGTYYQEGNGNTAGTVGAIVGAGLVGGLIVHGHNAEVPEGKEFTVTIKDDVPFTASDAAAPPMIDPQYHPAPVSMQVETEKERKERLKRQERAAKD